MSDECYQTKLWLNRNYNKAKQLEADKRMLEVMTVRLGKAVATYETDGSEHHDPDQSRAKHEDALLDYSEQKKKVEKEERELMQGMTATREAIDRLSDPREQAVAIDRYINRLKWNDIAKLEHFSLAQIHRIHAKMLENMSKIRKDLKEGRT